MKSYPEGPISSRHNYEPVPPPVAEAAPPVLGQRAHNLITATATRLVAEPIFRSRRFPGETSREITVILRGTVYDLTYAPPQEPSHDNGKQSTNFEELAIDRLVLDHRSPDGLAVAATAVLRSEFRDGEDGVSAEFTAGIVTIHKRTGETNVEPEVEEFGKVFPELFASPRETDE